MLIAIKSQEIRTIGIHSESNKTIVVKDGRFGPYITDGKVNVSLRGEFTPDTISLEQSIELINKSIKSRKKEKRKKVNLKFKILFFLTFIIILNGNEALKKR